MIYFLQVYCPGRRPVPAAGEKPGIQVSSGNPGASGHYSTKNIPTRPKELKQFRFRFFTFKIIIFGNEKRIFHAK